jgi:16S rRNA (cytosine967-C5)-methyltransferase
VRKLDPPVLAALRLGAYQLGYLEGVPRYAAVNESVELVRRARLERAVPFTNAVLRRVGEGIGPLLGGLPEGPLKHSYPDWIWDVWRRDLGEEDALALMRAQNEPPPVVVRHVRGQTPDGSETDIPGAYEVARVDAEALARGEIWPQSSGSQLAALVVGSQPGERVLDLCAAPGAKTTHLAALLEGQGAVVAVERHPGRADALRRTAERMGADGVVEVRTADAAAFDEPAAYDRVLVDPPCTDLGTLASRPDARWRKEPGDPARLARTQAAILRAGGRALRPGGTLVYSTCTISPAENEEVVRAFLAAEPGFTVAGLPSDLPLWDHPAVPGFAQTLPHRDGTEGFFIARLRREAAA